MKNKKFALFEGQKIRRVWDGQKEKWYFSVIDIIAILAQNDRPRKYWNDLKTKLKSEGSELSEKIGQLKLQSTDNKFYLTDVADTEATLRLIQSIPSPKAEPFKLWLARVGYERIEEMHDPELAINRALNTYLKKGYSQNWINQRLKSIEVRKALTDEWEKRGVKKGDEFAILTDDITLAWAGMNTREYKNYKNLKQESLRDNMTNLELVLNMLAETATTEISNTKEPKNLDENRIIAKEGGTIAGNARRQIEAKTGKKTISKDDFQTIQERKKLSNKSKN